MLRHPLSLINQLLNPKLLVAFTELLEQALPLLLAYPAAMALEIIKFLQAHHQPSSLLHAHPSALHDGPIQQDKPVRVRQVKMMGDRGVR